MKIILVCCLLTVNLGHAQSIEWFPGAVVLSSREILSGKFSVNLAHDLLLFQDGGKVSVYPAHEVERIHYYDQAANINRKFVSFRQRKNAMIIHRLFEVVVPGCVSVVRTCSLPLEKDPDNALAFRYYLTFEGEIVPICKFRSKLYPYLAGSSKALDSFIGENNLDINKTADVIRIVKFYNNGRSVQAVAGNDQVFGDLMCLR